MMRCENCGAVVPPVAEWASCERCEGIIARGADALAAGDFSKVFDAVDELARAAREQTNTRKE
jgi:hypothetical protein